VRRLRWDSSDHLEVHDDWESEEIADFDATSRAGLSTMRAPAASSRRRTARQRARAAAAHKDAGLVDSCANSSGGANRANSFFRWFHSALSQSLFRRAIDERSAVNFADTEATFVSIMPLSRSSERTAVSLRSWPGPLA